jgi:formiminoglutamate deiminase
MTRQIWCEYAWLGDESPDESVLVTIEDGRFVAVESGVAPAGTERRQGLSLPGFANSHSHAFHRALRGRTHSEGGDFWTWRDQMYRLAARLDPAAYFRLARATFSEMVMAGYTTVAEFHYLHHGPAGSRYADPNEMGLTIIAAARDAGIRITLLDTCYLHGGIGRELDVIQRRFGDSTVQGWIERTSQLRPAKGAVIGAAIHSVRACTPEEIAELATHVSSGPLHAHVSEQPRENEDCLAAYGATPTAIFFRSGALRSGFTAVHATHVTSEDRSLLGESESTVCVCPTTERDLADGVGDSRALLDGGVGLSLGSDSNAVIDAFDEARSLEHHERLTTRQRGRFTVQEQLHALTNHSSLGWPDAGAIRPGNRADLVTVDLESVRLAGSSPQTMLPTTIHAGSPADITTVMIDGVDRVSEGNYLAGDVGREFSDLLPRLFT